MFARAAACSSVRRRLQACGSEGRSRPWRLSVRSIGGSNLPKSSAESTSPGVPRSSQGTSVAGRARMPSSGTAFQAARAEDEWVAAVAVVTGRDDVPSARPPGRQDPANGLRREVGAVRRGTTTAASASEPKRGKAAAQRCAGTSLPLRTFDYSRRRPLSGWAPATTTISSTGLFARRSGPPGRGAACFGAAEARRRAGREHDGRDHSAVVTARMSARWIEPEGEAAELDTFGSLSASAGPPEVPRAGEELGDPLALLGEAVSLAAGVECEAEHADRVRLPRPEQRRRHGEVVVDARERDRLVERRGALRVARLERRIARARCALRCGPACRRTCSS